MTKTMKSSASLNDDCFPHSKHSKVKSGAKQASYQKQPIYHLIDDLKLGHIGFISNGRPVVIPMTIWRVEEFIYFHVANKSRLHKLLKAGEEIAISFAECSEWVMAKSAYQHSANYRSAVLYCTGSKVTDDKEFDHAFEVCIEQMEEGRWKQVRPPSKKERKATSLMKLQINEASFKSNKGGPADKKEDLDLPVWTGTIPVCPFHKNQEG